MKEIAGQIENNRRANGLPRYIIIGIDYGFAYQPKRIPVVIGK